MPEDAAMEDAPEVDAHGRLVGEAHTSGALRGADALTLDASAAAQSLFALEQVLQRDDAPATTKALRALTNGVRARDAAALATAAAWARASPRLAELFRGYAAPGGRDADAKAAACFRALATMLPLLPKADAQACWALAARSWGIVRALRSARHKDSRRAALEALEKGALCGNGAQQALRWLGEDEKAWLALCGVRGRDGTRSKALRVCAAVARSGSKDERKDACRLLLPALLKGLEEDAPRDVHLLLSALRPERDDANVVSALSSNDGAKALRVVAAYLRSSRKGDPGAGKAAKVARTWLCVLTARHADVTSAARGQAKPGHRRILKALDACCPGQCKALELALAAAPPLLMDILREGAQGYLGRPRPWDAGATDRSRSGTTFLANLLRATCEPAGPYDRSKRERDVALDVVARCLPPEAILTRKELGRGLRGGAAPHALDLVIASLIRFRIERLAAVRLYGGCDHTPGERPPVAAILACCTQLLDDPASQENYLMPPHRRRELSGRRLDYECRRRMAERLPDVQALVQLLPKRCDEHTPRVLDALLCYAQELPEALAQGRFDACKFVVNALTWPPDVAARAVAFCGAACAERLAAPTDTNAAKARDALFDGLVDATLSRPFDGGDALYEALRRVCGEVLVSRGLDADQTYEWLDALARVKAGAPLGRCLDALQRAPELLEAGARPRDVLKGAAAKHETDPFDVVAAYIDRREGRAPPAPEPDNNELLRTALAEDDAALNEVIKCVSVDLAMRGAAPGALPGDLEEFRAAVDASQVPPPLLYEPTSDLSTLAALLVVFDPTVLTALVRDAAPERVCALCEGLATAYACTGAEPFAAALKTLADQALDKASLDVVARMDAALFTRDGTIDVLSMFFARGGDGPHARERALALSARDAAALLVEAPDAVRAALAAKFPQLAAGVVGDAQSLERVLQAWTEGASNDACVAANAARGALLATEAQLEVAAGRASTAGADALLAAGVRAGCDITVDDCGPRLAQSLCAAPDCAFARSGLPLVCATHLDDTSLLDAALDRLEDAPPLSWSGPTVRGVVAALQDPAAAAPSGLRWVARVKNLATGALRSACEDVLCDAATRHITQALRDDGPVDEAFLLGEPHEIPEEVVAAALARPPSLHTLKALRHARAFDRAYVQEALADRDLRLHALLFLEDHPERMTLALAHYGGSLSQTDRRILDIMNRGGCTVDGPELAAWASRRGATGPLWPLAVFDGPQLAATVARFPLSRSAVVEDEEDDEAEGIDPRFLLPALFACLSACTNNKAQAARDAHRAGFAGYCLAALASTSDATRNYAFGILDLLGTFAKSDEAEADPLFRGRKAFCLLVDGVRSGAASKRDGFEDGVVPRFPCLAARVAAAVCDALQDPAHCGYQAAHQYVLRRASVRPWQDAPLLKEALKMPDTCKVPAFVAFTPSERLQKRTRRWAMNLLIEGCRDDESGRLLRDAHALPMLMAHYDALRTGGYDPVEQRLTFLGPARTQRPFLLRSRSDDETLWIGFPFSRCPSLLGSGYGDETHVPPGCKRLLDEPAYKLRRAIREVTQASNDALKLLEALLTTYSAKRALFHGSGLTSWARIHLSHQKTDDEGKDYAWCGRLIGWMAILYDHNIQHERVFEDAPLFFVDLDKGVRGVLNCLCDADLARVGFERPAFRAKRERPHDTLGVFDGRVEDPNQHMSASERVRMEARDVWSEDELDVPDGDIEAIESSIQRGRAAAQRRKELRDQDRSDTESTQSSSDGEGDAKALCFQRADELLLVDYFCQHYRPDKSEKSAAALLLHLIEPKDAYFYVFGVDNAPRQVSHFDSAVLALYLTKRMRVLPVPDFGDLLLKDTDWSQSPVLKKLYDEMRTDATTEAAQAADLALDNADLREVAAWVVETLILDEGVAASCLGRRGFVAACRFLATYSNTVEGRTWRCTEQARRVALLRAARGPGCGRFGAARGADVQAYGTLCAERLAADEAGARRGAAAACDALLAAALTPAFPSFNWPDDGAVLDAHAPEAPEAVAGARAALLRAALSAS